MFFVLSWSTEVVAADREVPMGRISLPRLPLGIWKSNCSLQGQNPSRLIKQTFSANLNRDALVVFPAGHLSLVSKLLVGNVNGPLHTLVLGNWINQLLNKMEVWLSNRTHMIQFCAIGMVIALVIIWWRKT